MSLDHVPPRNDVPGREVLADDPGSRTNVESVELDEVARLFDRVQSGFSHCVGPQAGALSRGDRHARGLFKKPALPEIPKNPTHHGRGNHPSLPSEEDHQLVFTPSGIRLPEHSGGLAEVRGPGRFSQPAGPMGSAFQSHNIQGIEPAEPPVEGLPGNPEIPTT
jgi:hypothetical protein